MLDITPVLAPCPFCGSTDDDLSCDVDEYGRAYVVCGNCATEGPFVVSHIIGSDAAIEQAIAAWNQRSAWQPIETAPGDGTEIFAWDGKGVKVAWCYEGRWIYDDEMESPYLTHWHPTHWQPLPQPPNTPNPHD
jgi:Lar family restriction alleviation protein